MVCLTCFIIPIGLWIWFQFIMPIIVRLKSFFFPEAVKTESEIKNESKKYECPFDFCKKKPQEQNDSEKILPDEKKSI